MSKHYRVAMVTGHFLPFAGGVESHVEQIARLLVDDGHSVDIFTQSDDPSWPSTEIIDGMVVRRHHVPIPSSSLAVSPSLCLDLNMRRDDYDVIHTHGYHSFAPLASTIARSQPMVFTPHYHGTGHSPFRKLLHRPYRVLGARIICASRCIICVSAAEAHLLQSHFPAATERIRVVPNGVDRTMLDAAQPMPWEGNLVISAGRLESYKHVDKTVAAMAQLPEDYTLVVTGDGPESERLAQLVASLGLAQRVRLLGRIDVADLYRWYQRADVYVSMSTNEAMPVTIVEMLAAGTRVVASDIPAHRDIKQRTRGAITIAPVEVSPADLAAAIRAAAATAPSADQDIPTWREVTDRTVEIYEDALRVR